ncbi:MAG: cytochrome c oxidase assembly protein subunit 15 [Enterobacterales bacterium]|jgi:cytochrome c oxidase assembly protein subunit 15
MSIDISLQAKHDRQVATWLIFVAAVIFFMIILGGATRLTHSGLSMVDWKPIMGVIPPLTETDWTQTFERYKEFPEYQKKNAGMSLDSFKTIFYFEYFHRILGRLIGLFFLLPFLYFWMKGAIRRKMLPQMIALFILGGMQGVLGWYMVKSGLVNEPNVSQYRLSAHLIAAVLLFSYLLWVGFGLLKKTTDELANDIRKRFYNYSKAVTGVIIFMIFSGGLVAGTKAGYAYNTFPLMAGKLIPDGMYSLQPFWLNWFENITAIQFNHRLIAYSLFIIVPLFAIKLIKNNISSCCTNAAKLFIGMLLVQIALGISTLIFHMPVSVAVSHQGGAIILLSIAIFITRELKTEHE